MKKGELSRLRRENCELRSHLAEIAEVCKEAIPDELTSRELSQQRWPMDAVIQIKHLANMVIGGESQ